MKSYFPKRILFWMFLPLSVFVAKGQTNSPYFITGPGEVCLGQCEAIFYVQSVQIGGLDQIAEITWTLPPGVITHFVSSYYSRNLCVSGPAGLRTILVIITTTTGNTYTIWQDFFVVACDNPLILSSNAAQFCPASNNMSPPPLPPPSGFTLTINDEDNVASGQQVCLEVTVDGFYDILGMQFSINYDPSALQFTGVTNLNLSGLGPTSFGTPSPGIIVMTWNDPNVSGISLPDGTPIFCLCFNVLLGSCASEITFTNTPIAIEVLNGNLDEVAFSGRPGHVRVTGSSNTGPNLPLPPMCCEQVCAGAKVRYTASIETDAFFFVEWEDLIGTTSYQGYDNNKTLEVEWGNPGTGTIRARVGNKVVERCVNIIALPEAAFSADPPANGDTLQVCQGQSVNFSNTSQDAIRYLWDFGDTVTSTEPSPEHVWNNAGIYLVALIAYNECLCTDTSFLNVVVLPIVAPNLNCRGTVCEGTAVTYNTDADCGTFLWVISPNGTITNGGGTADNFITIDWTNGPEGYIQLQVENCAANGYCAAPNLMRVPIISENAEINGSEVVCRAQMANYTIPLYGGIEYVWSTSGLGTIQAGQGSNEVSVQWANAFSTQPEWVAVEYYNCYLDCGGVDTIWVAIRPEFYVEGVVEGCLSNSRQYAGRRFDNYALVSCNWEVRAADGSVVWASTSASSMLTIPWNFGTGDFSVFARPAVPNNYCNEVSMLPVRIFGLPPAPAGITGENIICPGINYTYSTVGILPGNSVKWQLTGQVGSGFRTGNSINVVWDTSPPYKIVLRQVNPQDCSSPSIEFNLMHLPPISVSGNATVCAEETATYTVQAFSEVDYVWTISPADAGTILGTPNSSTIEILWHKAGLATLALSVCDQNTAIPITINPKPVPLVLHPEAVCPGATAIVQTTESFTSYSWKNENGAAASNAAMPGLSFGYYQVSVTNSFGCTGEALFHIDRYGAPDISASTPDNTGICPGDPPSTLYALDTEEGYTYQWFHQGSPIPGATNVTYPTVVLGNYQVQVTDHNGCTALSNTLNLFFYCGPNGGGFPCNAPPGTGTVIDCEPNTGIQFAVQSTPVCNTSNYLNISQAYLPGTLTWNFGDPTSGAANTSSLENPSHTFNNAGFYAVYLFGQALTPDPELCFGSGVDTVPLAANFFYKTACAGDTVHFFNTSTYLPIESVAAWQWDLGDPASGPANTSTEKDPSHIYISPGVYPVTLTATAASGCSVTKTLQVFVAGAPEVSFDLPTVNCANTALPFVAVADTSSVRIRWYFGDPDSGAADTSSLSQTFHRYNTPGNYTTRVEATNIYGCINRFSQSMAITTNDLSGAITFTSPICEGDSSLLTAPPGGIHWTWSTGDTTQTIWAREEGTYSVVVANANGCQYEPEDAALRVIPAPNTTIRTLHFDEDGLLLGYGYDSLSVCEGKDVFLEVIENYGQTYMWSNGHPGPSLEFSEERGSLLSAGEHSFFVTVTEPATSCSSIEGPFRVIVRPLPAIPIIAATPSGLICEGTTVMMSVNNPEPGVSYSWSSGAQGNVLETSLAGQYNVVATNAWGCVNTSAPYTILSGPDINLIPSGCHTRCRPDTLCFPSVPHVATYQWFMDGVAQGPASATVPQIVTTQSGDYYMQMITEAGCSLNSDPLTLDLFDGYGRILGQVYWDLNDNGALDPTDSLLADVPFILLSGTTPIDTFLSQTGGTYGFYNILSSNYGLQIDTTSLPLGLVTDTIRIDTIITGCDAAILINWRLSCTNSTASLTLNACPGSTADYNGTALAVGTTTDFTYTNAAGCNSTVTVTVNALAPSTASLTLTACSGAFADYNGTALPAGSTTDFTYTNVVGCDSIVTVAVNSLAPSTASLTLSACPDAFVDYNGTALAPGSVTDFTLTNAVGCDSIVTVSVELLTPSTASLTLEACPGSAAVYNGTMIPVGTTMDFTLTNAVGCDSVLTVTVNALPASVANLTLNACPGNAINFNGVELEPGTTTEFTFVNTAGCDSVFIVTATVFELPEYEVEGIASCPGQPSGSIAISGQGLAGYALDGPFFQETALFEGLAPGSYTVFVADNNGCVQSATVQIGAFPPLQIQIANTLIPCNAPSITLEALALSGDDGNLRFLWDNGITTSERTVEAAGAYQLTVMNDCDTLVQTVAVQYDGVPDDTPIYMPNGFSPNGDGVNDVFRAFASNEVSVLAFELLIFDRWGNQLFHSQDLNTGWDGNLRDKPLDPGVYVWWLQATVFHCGRMMEIKKKGDLTLVR